MTSERAVPRLSRWPFFLGDAVLVALAGVLVSLGVRRMDAWSLLVCGLCVGVGAWLSVWPFVLEYRAAVRLAEGDGLAATVSQIRNLERVATQIDHATGHWQSALDQSAKTVAAANEIADRMTAEAKAFAEFMRKANDTEKAHLRLEVEKLRRAEGDWLQILTRVLDHVWALYSAALRSGQPNLIEQLQNFQNACRDAARRVGLVPIVAAPREPFDTNLHQLPSGEVDPPADVEVTETLVAGYTFRGQLLRKAVVALAPGATPSVSDAPEPDRVRRQERPPMSDAASE